MTKMDKLLDGEAEGFQPTKPIVASDEVMEERLFGKKAEEPEAEAEEAEAEEKPAAQPEPADSDLRALRAAGWSNDDLKGISREAAERHALREAKRQKQPERTAEPVGSDDLTSVLTEEFGAKTAKRLAPLLAGMRDKQGALERTIAETKLEGLRSEFEGTYPEIRSDAALSAVQHASGGALTRDAFERGLRAVYGQRAQKQSQAEKEEASAQVAGQFGGTRRGPKPISNSEKSKEAAWREYEKSDGDVKRALDVRRRTGG